MGLSMEKRYVCSFAFSTDRQRVLLIRKNRPAWQAGKLNGVGGKMEPGETPHAAARREFREETGLDLAGSAFAHILTLQGADDISIPAPPGAPAPKTAWRGHFFRLITDIDQARSITDEQLEIVPVNPLPAKMISNLHWIIPMLLDKWLEDGEYTVQVHQAGAPGTDEEA